MNGSHYPRATACLSLEAHLTDLTDPLVILAIALVILTLTMVAFILSFRSNNVAIKEALIRAP